LPPTAPVLSDYKIRDEGIEIGWINSPDPDVVWHRIWRCEKKEGYTPPDILAVIDDNATTSYIDTSALVGVHYVYTVTAAKRNLLESRASNALTLFTNKPKGKTMTIDRLDAVMDKQNKMLKLIWSDKLQDVLHYEIYKGVNEEKLTLWKTVSADKNVREILDEDILVNETYRYAVRAILKSGRNTGAKTLIVKF
jgi:fibronectin type 3 domain-containing protein